MRNGNVLKSRVSEIESALTKELVYLFGDNIIHFQVTVYYKVYKQRGLVQKLKHY